MAESRDTLDLSTALLKWVQSFQTGPQATTLVSLRDGQILYQILQDIDPDYFIEELPSSNSETSNKWIPRWQNLKYIDRVVRAYVRDVCGVLDSSSEVSRDGQSNIDLKAVAQYEDGKSDKDTIALLRGILRAAMYSPSANQRMGRVVVGLGPEAAKLLATTLAEMEQDEPEESGLVQQETNDSANGDVFTDTMVDTDKKEETSISGASGRDAGLEQEEKLIQAHRIIRQLEESNAKAATELEDLRKDKTSLEEAIDSFKYEMENSGQNKTDNDAMRQLKTRSDRDRDYIAELENELETTRTAAETYEKHLERLKTDGDSKQALKDDLQLVKAERDDLLNKTRANENLRKKIQTLQDQEKQNATLRDDLRSAQDQLQTLDSLKQRCEALQKANTENMNIIANTEQEIFDQKTSRKRLEHEYKVLQQKWEIARERQVRDHETITELETKLQSLELQDETSMGLEKELSSADARPSVSRQHSIAIPSADLTMLEEKLRTITSRNNSLESSYLDLLQDKLGLETTLSELRDPSKEPEENIPFLEQRKKLQTSQTDLAKLKEAMFATTAELASVKEKLLTTSDALINGNSEAVLNREGEYSALSKAYADLTKHAEDLEVQLAEERSLVRHALLSHAALLLEPADVRKRNEYEVLVKQMHEVREHEDDAIVTDVATAVAGKIESGRDGVVEAQKTIQEHEATIAALREEIAGLAKAKPVGPTAGVGDEKALAALKRENQLITSAWYDLSSRLQSSTVSVSRRREDPKSWLGKQRQLVGLGLK